MRHRPEYVARDARRVPWPVADRAVPLEQPPAVERSTEQDRERALGRALIAFTALVVVASVGGLLAAMLFGPDPVRWVWP